MRIRVCVLSLVILTTLISAARCSVPDSIRWPFPDSLPTSFSIEGLIRDYHIAPGNPNAHDYVVRSTIYVPQIASFTSFKPEDLVSVHESTWSFTKALPYGQRPAKMTLTLVLDTTSHLILRYLYHYESAPPYSENCDISLRNLHFSDSGITFPDNDYDRHVDLVSYSYEDEVFGFQGEYSGLQLLTGEGILAFKTDLRGALNVPDQIDFGSTASKAFQDTSLFLFNKSDAPIQILSYQLLDSLDNFAFLDTTLHSILPLDTGRIALRFSGSNGKSFSGLLNIRTDEPHTFSIHLLGQGRFVELELSSIPAPFLAEVGSTVSEILTLRNVGNILGNVDSFGVLGRSAFTVHSPLAPFSIRPKDSIQFALAFSPDSMGYFRSRLNAVSHDGAQTQMELVGVGRAVSSSNVQTPSSTRSSIYTISWGFAARATIILKPWRDYENVHLDFYDELGRVLASQEIASLPYDRNELRLQTPIPSNSRFVRLCSGVNTLALVPIYHP